MPMLGVLQLQEGCQQQQTACKKNKKQHQTHKTERHKKKTDFLSREFCGKLHNEIKAIPVFS